MFRCLRIVRCGAHREFAGEIPVRFGGILPDAVRQPASPFWQVAAATAFAPYGLVTSHRAALLRAARGQDAHRDAHQRYAPLRFQFQLALHAIHVKIRKILHSRAIGLSLISHHTGLTVPLPFFVPVILHFHHQHKVSVYL